MSGTKGNATSATVKNEISIVQTDDSVDCNVEYDDTLSVAYTNFSDHSNSIYNLECNGREIRPNFLENIEPSNSNIESVCVQNSTDVTFGNKTYFNGPVIIKNFVVDGNTSVLCSKIQEESDKLNPLKNNSTKQTFNGDRPTNIAFCFRNKSSFVIVTEGSVAVIIALIVTGLVYFLESADNDSVDPNATVNFEFVERYKYGAQSPKSVGEPLALPVKQVIISHTATPNCTNYSNCVLRVLQIQDYHMRTNRWDDIGLNFLVGGDRRAYEGCGYTVGAHTINYNKLSICIAFIGDFQSYEAPEKQLKAAQRLIDVGISMNKIHPDYVLYGQRQLRNFDSPGILLFNQIILWPHWSKDILPM